MYFLNLKYDSTNFNNTGSNSDLSATSTKKTKGLLCGYCKAGFKPSVMKDENSNDIPFVKTCTEITGCEATTNWYNSCSKCKTGFSYSYNSTTNIIDHTVCISNKNNSSSCLAYSSTENLCKVCKRGYNLNKDFICEKLKAKYCKSNFLN